MLQFVYENNGFYRDRFKNAGLSPDNFHSPEDIKLLPLLSKAEVRENTLAMLSHGYDYRDLQKAKTGGSTGKSLILYFTEECSSLRNACTLRHDLWSGWKRGEPIAAIWGNPVFPVALKEKIRQYFAIPSMIFLDTMAVSSASVVKFVEQWHKVEPTLIFGHAHSIFILANMLEDMQIRDIRPAGIISSSMMLLSHERKKIEEIFGTRVIDRYGCEEVSLIASECEKHEGMHLNIDQLYIEFIKGDGSLATPGEPGNIVVTDLINYAMPFIRYLVEDVGVQTDRKCSCGRGLPLMESVTGRVADFLVKRDGSRVAGVSLIENTLTRFPGINQMQIIQDDYDKISINLVAESSSKDEIMCQLSEYFKSVFGETVIVRFLLVNEILPEKSGKYRFSICNINKN